METICLVFDFHTGEFPGPPETKMSSLFPAYLYLVIVKFTDPDPEVLVCDGSICILLIPIETTFVPVSIMPPTPSPIKSYTLKLLVLIPVIN